LLQTTRSGAIFSPHEAVYVLNNFDLGNALRKALDDPDRNAAEADPNMLPTDRPLEEHAIPGVHRQQGMLAGLQVSSNSSSTSGCLSSGDALLDAADCAPFTAPEGLPLLPVMEDAKPYDNSITRAEFRKDQQRAKKRATWRAKRQAHRDASITFRMDARITDKHIQNAAVATTLRSLNGLKGNAASGAFVGKNGCKPRPDRPWTLDEVKKQNLKVIHWDGR
jgi:hypothetical protein